MKIISEIVGGIGNQMFCYACGKAYALRHNAELVLDVGFFNKALYGREYRLDLFGINDRKISSKGGNTIRRIKTRVFKLLKSKRYIVENDVCEWDERLFASPPDAEAVRLIGYWQNEDFFKDCKVELKEVFSLNIGMSEENEALLKEIRESESVGIHYRTYTELNQHKGLSFFVTMHRDSICSVPIDYYQMAIESLEKKNKDLKYYIFGSAFDDKMKRLFSGRNVVFVDINKAKGLEIFDMILLGNCKNMVLANSSFSWWAGWLSEVKNIFYPENNGLFFYPTPPDSWNIVEWGIQDHDNRS